MRTNTVNRILRDALGQPLHWPVDADSGWPYYRAPQATGVAFDTCGTQFDQHAWSVVEKRALPFGDKLPGHRRFQLGILPKSDRLFAHVELAPCRDVTSIKASTS